MVIYTKTGDDGTTAIFTKKGGKSVRLSKHDPLIEAIGSVDEVNSYLGIIAEKIKNQKSKIKLKNQCLNIKEIQRDLFTMGAILAGAELKIQESKIKNLEFSIDKMETELPKITGFILPGGSEISAHLMYARTLVRKAERRIVEQFQIYTNKRSLRLRQKYQYQISNENKKIILNYINRLSDYLFVQARWVNHQSNIKELEWKMK